MRIQGEKLFVPSGGAQAKVSGAGFGKMLSQRMKSAPFSSLVKDAFAGTAAQAAEEAETICADETGESIDMQALDDLLNIIINERDGKNA